MEIRVDNQSEAFVAVIQALATAPVVAPRGLKVREMAERTSVRIAFPQDGFVQANGRAVNHAITAIEGTSLVGQVSVPELVTDRVAAFAPYANDGLFWGAYGPRAAGDVGLVVDLLKGDPDSRQAVISLYDSDRDLGRKVKDVPCTVALQFLLREKDLHMWVVMRSNDAWLGLPYDLGQFSLLQFAIAQALDAEVGSYTHSVGSMHLYERDWGKAAAVRDPVSMPVGHRFGGDGSIESTARRCRRVLLGQENMLTQPMTALDAWLVSQVTR